MGKCYFYVQIILKKSKHWNNTSATTAFTHQHTHERYIMEEKWRLVKTFSHFK